MTSEPTNWGPWLDLADPAARKSVAAASGLYRIRGRGNPDLLYVGQICSSQARRIPDPIR
jgi:hypothetical protein